MRGGKKSLSEKRGLRLRRARLDFPLALEPLEVRRLFSGLTLGSPVAAIFTSRNPSTAPRLADIQDTTVNVGSSLTLHLSATGALPLAYSLIAPPAGMTVNATSGLIT